MKGACARAGLDPTRYGGHSLRAGLITPVIEGGATEHRTMLHSRHKSMHVFRTYVRDLNLLDGDNPVTRVRPVSRREQNLLDWSNPVAAVGL